MWWTYTSIGEVLLGLIKLFHVDGTANPDNMIRNNDSVLCN